MIHWLKTPKLESVAHYIECYWLLEKSSSSDSYEFPKLNPDPACHFILSPREQPYHYQLENESIAGLGSHWLFPHCQTFKLDHTKPFIHLGIKFRVGALYSLPMRAYTHPMLNSIKPETLNQLLNKDEISDQYLLDLARINPSLCCKQLDKLFLSWFEEAKEDKHSKLTRKVLPLLDKHPISNIGELVFCSQRTLERSFNRVTGLTMKQCQSMNKLEMMLAYLQQKENDAIDWIDIAYQFEFSDQPHLIRYLKKRLGLTPKNYIEQRNFTIDVYGGVDLP